MNINNFHQSIEDMIRGATPEQRILWNYVFYKFGENIAVEQFYYVGVTNPFGTTPVGLHYLAYNIELSSNNHNDVNPAWATFLDETLTQIFTLQNSSAGDVTIGFAENNAETKNIIFRRFSVNVFTHCKIQGFKLRIS